MNKFCTPHSRWREGGTGRDFALAGTCLWAAGALVGLAVPGRKKRRAAWAASAFLAAAYVPLMIRFLPHLLGDRIAIEDIYR